MGFTSNLYFFGTNIENILHVHFKYMYSLIFTQHFNKDLNQNISILTKIKFYGSGMVSDTRSDRPIHKPILVTLR